LYAVIKYVYDATPFAQSPRSRLSNWSMDESLEKYHTIDPFEKNGTA
jgi:hypothetical protein